VNQRKSNDFWTVFFGLKRGDEVEVWVRGQPWKPYYKTEMMIVEVLEGKNYPFVGKIITTKSPDLIVGKSICFSAKNVRRVIKKSC